MGRRRLKTLCDLRRYVASLINRVEHGEVEPNKASKLGYLSNILKSIIEGSALEERVRRLEDQAKGSLEKWRRS